jgi:hypothetical protein
MSYIDWKVETKMADVCMIVGILSFLKILSGKLILVKEYDNDLILCN